MDYGHEMTDKILAGTENEIDAIYREAWKSAKVKAEEYTRKFAEKDVVMRKKVEDGSLTEEEYKHWRINKMTVGARYKAMEEALSTDLTNADKIAASVINGHLPEVYATNYNWASYAIEQDARIDTNFVLYDRQSVERLIRDKPDLLPKAKIDIPKDKLWNKKNINNAITQGVLLGESIPDIAKRLANVTDMNRKSAIRNARTMTTSAESGGRIDSYKRAEEMGIKLTQEWLATNDGRTRHEHRMLNGQEVKVGEPFKVDGYEIRFPADPQAEGFLVYNCRCTLISNFKGFDYKKMDGYVDEPEMTYQEWEEQHEVAEEKLPRPKTTEGWAYETANSYRSKKQAIQDINNIVDNAPVEMQKLWYEYGQELDPAIPAPKGEAYFAHGDKHVHFNGKEVQEGNVCHYPYQNHFHEYMHNIDYICGVDRKMFSDTWIDENGNTLEDVIMGEWYKKFGRKRTNVEIATKAFAEMYTTNKDGMQGVSDFVSVSLNRWRRNNKIPRDDAKYLKLKNELNRLQTYGQYSDFYKRNADLFVTADMVKDLGWEVDKAAVKTYIKDIRNKYTLKDRGNLSDMMQKFTVKELDMDRPLGVGHEKKYFNTAGKLSNEAFAEFADSSFVSPASLKLLKQELPESYATWQKMVKQLITPMGGGD